MPVNLNSQLRWDELGSSGVQNVVSCDDFFVDELLNFSQEDVFEGRANGEEEKDKEDKGLVCVSVSAQEPGCENPNESCYVTDGFGCLPTTRLSVLIDDLAYLEWLANFVDDSFSEHSAPCPTGIWTGKSTLNELERETKAFTPPAPQPCFKTPVPAKARSKRSRIGGRVSVVGSSSLMESSSRSTRSPSSSSSPSSSLLLYNTVVSLPKEIVYQYAEPPATKPKIKSAVNENGGTGTTQTTWRCNHCGVQKTPLCRAGPIGAKTLCNACGIRYKSGRLLPEYRPACSPTFSTELHSNHHLQVLQMRRKKDDSRLPEQGFNCH